MNLVTTAHAVATFVSELIRALKGEPDVIADAYVESSLIPGLPYFASPVKIGRKGMEKEYELDLSEYEASLLSAAIPLIRADIERTSLFLQSLHL